MLIYQPCHFFHIKLVLSPKPPTTRRRETPEMLILPPLSGCPVSSNSSWKSSGKWGKTMTFHGVSWDLNGIFMGLLMVYIYIYILWSYRYISGWWLSLPLWNIWKSVGMIMYSQLNGKKKQCSKPPSSLKFYERNILKHWLTGGRVKSTQFALSRRTRKVWRRLG